ncbi:MAG TPA: sensor domain-containing diguanylate cyclase [Mesotoga sp.]|nr:sensor domain-containing diguanylate cyclase [Mesotoga sp.]NLX33414.1 sensor domain-containing diguanylate cyclase [Thermotogaceae bacterium]MDD5745333.1 sensor domain-containing diguanylate cyclase [Mesotoga sp.]HPB63509.1 sensor domain-containing diguanylate cyclase [Mesotoga sp.]HPI16596.1 sensor domain-containing diguanylate cyclase [Mesotoga sp.]
MDYSKYTYEQLLKKVVELDMLNRELLREREQETRLDYSWAGNLGHWYWNIKSNSVVFNPLKVTVLGYSMEELPREVNYQYFTERLHPDDYQGTMDAMLLHMHGKKTVYEAEYRIQAKDGSWKWFYDRGKITQRDEKGAPLFATGIVFDITRNKERELNLERRSKDLERDARTDPLTGIGNRRAIIGELEDRLVEASINRTPISVIMLDIDHFKVLNDTKGHLFGDSVLKEIATIIRNNLRGLDTVGRYGGEEFLVVLPNTAEENAASVAERIRRKVEDFDFGEGSRVTISAGVGESPGGEDIETLIDLADKRLYEAKRTGRNVVIASRNGEP